MGFLQEIERERQLELQQKLLAEQRVSEDRKAVKLQADYMADTYSGARKNAETFIEDSGAVVELMDSLSQLGYIDYFKGVARITSSILSGIIFMRTKGFLGQNDISAAERNLWKLHKDSNLKPSNQELKAKEELDKRIIEYGRIIQDGPWKLWPYDRWANPRALVMVHQPDTQFFNDNSGNSEKNWRFVDERTNRFTEPQEVGVGFRFTKLLKPPHTEVYEGKLDGWSDKYVTKTTVEQWLNAVYIRVRASNQATLTGSIQQDVGISDIGLFDNVLEELIRRNPVSIYAKETESFVIWGGRPSDGGGH